MLTMELQGLGETIEEPAVQVPTVASVDRRVEFLERMHLIGAVIMIPVAFWIGFKLGKPRNP